MSKDQLVDYYHYCYFHYPPHCHCQLNCNNLGTAERHFQFGPVMVVKW